MCGHKTLNLLLTKLADRVHVSPSLQLAHHSPPNSNVQVSPENIFPAQRTTNFLTQLSKITFTCYTVVQFSRVYLMCPYFLKKSEVFSVMFTCLPLGP